MDVDSPDAARATHVQSGSVSASARRVAQVLLDLGPSRVSDIASRLGFSNAAVGKHLDQLEAAGWAVAANRGTYGPAAVAPLTRGRGRPARVWSLTTVGAESLAARTAGHDDCAVVANTALDLLRQVAGDSGVNAVAAAYASTLEQRWLEQGVSTAQELADTLTAQGYVAVATQSVDGGAQVCQHHCPIHDVAAAHPAFCELETAAMSATLGTNVVRLATIAGGSPVCTTLIPSHARARSAGSTTTHPPMNGDAR